MTKAAHAKAWAVIFLFVFDTQNGGNLITVMEAKGIAQDRVGTEALNENVGKGG